jgi:hypothetical protein
MLSISNFDQSNLFTTCSCGHALRLQTCSVHMQPFSEVRSLHRWPLVLSLVPGALCCLDFTQRSFGYLHTWVCWIILIWFSVMHLFLQNVCLYWMRGSCCLCLTVSIQTSTSIPRWWVQVCVGRHVSNVVVGEYTRPIFICFSCISDLRMIVAWNSTVVHGSCWLGFLHTHWWGRFARWCYRCVLFFTNSHKIRQNRRMMTSELYPRTGMRLMVQMCGWFTYASRPRYVCW